MIIQDGCNEGGLVYHWVTWDGVISWTVTDLEITYYPEPFDVNADSVVNILDLIAAISAFGVCEDCAEDVIQDGIVDIFDLLLVIDSM